jgi:hypothetical protein
MHQPGNGISMVLSQSLDVMRSYYVLHSSKGVIVAIRDKLRANAEHVLQPGEVVQSIFVGQTTSQWFALISMWIIILKSPYRVVVVTDRRILVCRSGRFRTTPVKEVVAELPRSTRIGPASGLWYKCETLGDRLYIHKRFHKDVAAADAAVSGVV